MSYRSHRLALTAAVVVLAALVGGPREAFASSLPGPGWEITASSFPTNLTPGSRGTIAINVFNVGAAASNGAITVTDTLPSNVVAREAGEVSFSTLRFKPESPSITNEFWMCTGNGPGGAVAGASVVTCTNTSELPSMEGAGGVPTRLGPFLDPEIGIAVEAHPEERTAVNHVAIVGGGAPTQASSEDHVTVSSLPAAFGFSQWDVWFSNADGTSDTQAGSHPYEATFDYKLDTALREGESKLPAETRNIEVLLPPGFVGDATAVPRCTRQELNANSCPQYTQVGTTEISTFPTLTLPVYNLVPSPGVPAEFGFNILNIYTLLESTVRSGGDYGITTTVDNVPQFEIQGAILTIWGVPGEKSHDPWRNTAGGGCRGEECSTSGTHPSLQPFLTLPTSCR